MTAGANRLTFRAKPPNVDTGSIQTAPASDFRAFLAAFEPLGYEIASLVDVAGLRQSDLGDPDTRVPCAAYGVVVFSAQKERFTPNLALRLAMGIPVGAFPLLDYLVLTSDNVGAGVRQLARYFRLVGNPIVLETREDRDPIEIAMTAGTSPFAVEYTATLMVRHVRGETDGRFTAEQLTFSHRPDDVGEFERLLGCPVPVGASWNGMSVGRDAWNLPLRRRDPVLRSMLEGHAQEIMAALPDGSSFAQEVERALISTVAGAGDARVEVVARRLATSTRTLQRRLAEEGLSYQGLLDDWRRAAAAKHLVASRLSISEVAYLVGYSEPAPFHRAFKRWYGVTPHAFRQQQVSAANELSSSATD
jgi:AraC-like DNA-binding protein